MHIHHYIQTFIKIKIFFESDHRNIVKIFQNDSSIFILLSLELLFLSIFLIPISFFFYNLKKNLEIQESTSSLIFSTFF